MECKDRHLQRLLPLLPAALPLLLAAPAMADEGFFPRAEAPGAPRLERAWDAAVVVEATDGLCSGTLLSREGHVLTALHCLLPDLKKAGALLPDKKDGFVRIESPPPGGLALPRVLVKSAGIFGPAGSKARLLVLGRALFLPEGQGIEIPQSPERSEDFALLVVDPPPKRPAPCLEPGPVSRAGAKVWAVGFPGPARRAGRASDGKARRASFGHLLAGFRASAWFKGRGLAPEAFAAMDSFFLGDRAWLTDLDSAGGLSGAAVVDAAGKLAGILSSTGDEAQFADGTTLVVRADWIRAQVEKRLGAAGARRAFRCAE